VGCRQVRGGQQCVREGCRAIRQSDDQSIARFTASLTTQAERKRVMSAMNSANDALDVDAAVNNDKRKSLSILLA